MRSEIRELPDRTSEAVFNPENYVALASRPQCRDLLLATIIEGALVAGVISFVAPFLHEVYGLSFGGAGLVIAWFGLGALAYARLASGLISRMGEPRMVLFGTLLMAAAVTGAATSRHWAVLVPAEFLLGLGYFMMHTVLQARATELLPHARSTAVSSFVFALFLGQSFGAVAAGGPHRLRGIPDVLRLGRRLYGPARSLAVSPHSPLNRMKAAWPTLRSETGTIRIRC